MCCHIGVILHSLSLCSCNTVSKGPEIRPMEFPMGHNDILRCDKKRRLRKKKKWEQNCTSVPAAGGLMGERGLVGGPGAGRVRL